MNIGVILESEIVWEKFRGGTEFREPIVVHFADYTKGKQFQIDNIFMKMMNWMRNKIFTDVADFDLFWHSLTMVLV